MTYKIFEGEKEVNRIVSDKTFVEKYCMDNGYTYQLEMRPEPEIEPEKTQPGPVEVLETLVVDHEYRLTLLELGVTE